MQRAGLEQDNKAWKTYSEKEDCAGWVTSCGWTTDGYHNRHYTGMTLNREEAEVAALDRQEWRRSVAQIAQCIHLDAS